MCNMRGIVQVDFSFFANGERKCKDNEKMAGIKMYEPCQKALDKVVAKAM